MGHPLYESKMSKTSLYFRQQKFSTAEGIGWHFEQVHLNKKKFSEKVLRKVLGYDPLGVGLICDLCYAILQTDQNK